MEFVGKSRKRSAWWLHFSPTDDDKANCDYCKVNISIKGGATSNLRKHLASKHPIIIEEIKKNNLYTAFQYNAKSENSEDTKQIIVPEISMNDDEDDRDNSEDLWNKDYVVDDDSANDGYQENDSDDDYSVNSDENYDDAFENFILTELHLIKDPQILCTAKTKIIESIMEAQTKQNLCSKNSDSSNEESPSYLISLQNKED